MMYSRDVRPPRQLALHQPSLPLADPQSTTGHSKAVVSKPEGNRTETFSPQLPEQGAEEWRGKGGGGVGNDFVSGNKNSNPASPKPWVTSLSSNRSVGWVNISKYGEAGWRMSEKSPFSLLWHLKNMPLFKTEFLTRSKLLTAKEVDSQPFHTLSNSRKKPPPPQTRKWLVWKALSSS